MPAAGETMETATGMKEAPPKVEEKPEWWASPAVIGLMGFGTTTMIAGLSNLPTPYGAGFGGNWVVFGMAIFFGGMAQLIAGFVALRKGNMFAGSAFVGYGAFWLAFTSMLYVFAGTAPTGTPILWGVAAFAFILLTVKCASLAAGQTTFNPDQGANWAVGGEIIFDGFLAWYVATADLTNWNYGRKILPA